MKDVTLADQVEAVNALPEAVARLNADVESRAAQPAAGDQADAENHPPALRATSRQREGVWSDPAVQLRSDHILAFLS